MRLEPYQFQQVVVTIGYWHNLKIVFIFPSLKHLNFHLFMFLNYNSPSCFFNFKKYPLSFTAPILYSSLSFIVFLLSFSFCYFSLFMPFHFSLSFLLLFYYLLFILFFLSFFFSLRLFFLSSCLTGCLFLSSGFLFTFSSSFFIFLSDTLSTF